MGRTSKVQFKVQNLHFGEFSSFCDVTIHFFAYYYKINV